MIEVNNDGILSDGNRTNRASCGFKKGSDKTWSPHANALACTPLADTRSANPSIKDSLGCGPMKEHVTSEIILHTTARPKIKTTAPTVRRTFAFLVKKRMITNNATTPPVIVSTKYNGGGNPKSRARAIVSCASSQQIAIVIVIHATQPDRNQRIVFCVFKSAC